MIPNIHNTSQSTTVLASSNFLYIILFNQSEIMDTLPLEIVDKMFEYLPLNELVTYSTLNDQCYAAACHQLKLRCNNINLSSLHPWRESSVRDIFARIGPFIRHINVDLIYPIKWIPTMIASCPELESLQYIYRVDSVCHDDLRSLKALSFVKVNCSEEMIRAFLYDRCRNLETLSIERTDFTGSCLMVAPTNLRRLNFMNSKLKLVYIVDYLRTNPNMEDLCIQVDEDTADLTVLLKNLKKIHTLGLIGKKIVTDGFEQLAKLPNLVRLDIQVNSDCFYKYPEAIVEKTQQLRELNITLDNITVTHQFAESLTRFKHLTKLTICIGISVENSKLLLPYLNQLGKHGQLQTLILAGFTPYLNLDDNHSQLKNINQVRVCSPIICRCKDHFAIFYRH